MLLKFDVEGRTHCLLVVDDKWKMVQSTVGAGP